MFDIEEELKKLPGKPGVYLMHDAKDAIIYVGKAISLKNRVRQYFQPSRNVSPKIEKMISQIDHFEYIITDSEVEALVLESNLIKEHRPKYNTMLKDDKSYPFIKATVGEDFPRLSFPDRKNGTNRNISVLIQVQVLQRIPWNCFVKSIISEAAGGCCPEIPARNAHV